MKGSVSKISDYITWFNTQPEVKDSSAYGDYEYYLLTGTLTITGRVRACLVDINGDVLNPDTLAAIELRLAKDLILVGLVTQQIVT